MSSGRAVVIGVSSGDTVVVGLSSGRAVIVTTVASLLTALVGRAYLVGALDSASILDWNEGVGAGEARAEGLAALLLRAYLRHSTIMAF